MAPSNIDSRLLETPVSDSLLVPCRVAYPFKELSSEGDLKALFNTFAYNIGQATKCYNKDETLVEEVKRKQEDVDK